MANIEINTIRFKRNWSWLQKYVGLSTEDSFKEYVSFYLLDEIKKSMNIKMEILASELSKLLGSSDFGMSVKADDIRQKLKDYSMDSKIDWPDILRTTDILRKDKSASLNIRDEISEVVGRIRRTLDYVNGSFGG